MTKQHRNSACALTRRTIPHYTEISAGCYASIFVLDLVKRSMAFTSAAGGGRAPYPCMNCLGGINELEKCRVTPVVFVINSIKSDHRYGAVSSHLVSKPRRRKGGVGEAQGGG